jgi:hypothetical protein
MLRPVFPTAQLNRMAAHMAPAVSADSQAGNNPLRKAALALSVLFVFIRFSWLHNIQHALLGFNMGLLYLVGVPALLGMALSGGLGRTMKSRTAVWWIAFNIWVALATLFSTWVGGSAPLAYAYFKTNTGMLFVIPGLVLKWRECTRMMYAIACAGAASLLYARMFSTNSARLELGFGTIANSNDYAVHLLLVAPFVLWIGLRWKFAIFKIASLAALGYAAYLILSTASRGALVGLAVMALVAVIIGTARQRLVVLTLAPLTLIGLAAAVGQSTWGRLVTFSTEEGNQEAAASAQIREYLLGKSIAYTFQHPLFGVGPGMFAIYEGSHETTVNGARGTYHNAHNSYTIASSECGLPGLAFYLLGIGSTFGLLLRTHKKAKDPRFKDIRDVTFCVILGYAGYCTAVTFTNFTFMFYPLAMAGLAIAIATTAEREFRERPLPPTMSPGQIAWTGPRP